jgi:hypothetical protein
MGKNDENFRLREAAEPKEKACQTCGIVKPASEYHPVPSGGRAFNCNECRSVQVEAAREVKAKRITASDETIQFELWSQYDKAKNTSEKIRCLEALVKLRPQGKQSDLEEPAVVAEMMKRLKMKKKNGESTTT